MTEKTSNPLDVVFFFGNGNSAAFSGGEQQAPLQKPWLLVFADFLRASGADLSKCAFMMPGTDKIAVLIPGGNWTFVDSSAWRFVQDAFDEVRKLQSASDSEGSKSRQEWLDFAANVLRRSR